MKTLILSFIVASLSCAAAQSVPIESQIQALFPELAGDVPEKRYEAQERLKKIAAEMAAPGRESARLDFNRAAVSFLENADTPVEANVWIVRQLQLVGNESTVPSLTTRLNGDDARLREAARLALEKIPGGGASLRAALAGGEGDLDFQIGLANSLGEVRDAGAVDVLSKLLAQEDLRAVSAGATALGKIATSEAKDALFTVLDNSPYDGVKKGAVARGLLEAAEATKDMIFLSALASTDLPGAVSTAAASAEIRIQPELAPKLLMDALVNHRPERTTAIIAEIEKLPAGKSVIEGGLESFPRTLEANKLVLFEALGRNRIARALSRLAAALNSGDAVQQEVAMRALASIGSRQSLEALLVFASSGDRNAKRGVMEALGETQTPLEEILKAIASGESEGLRALAVEGLVMRGDRSAGPIFLKAIVSEDKEMRSAGADGLSSMGGPDEVPELIGLLAKGNKEAGAAIVGISRNASDPDRVTQMLEGGLDSESADVTSVLLAAVAATGAPSGLELLATRAKTSGAAQDGAIRALAKWPDALAVDSLAAVAADKETTDAQHKIVMDALARFLRSEEAGSNEDRAKKAALLVGVGRNAGAKRVMISVLGSIKSPVSRKALAGFAKDPDLKEDAELALKNFGKK